MIHVRKDLTGQTFGLLVVLEQVEDYVSPNGKRDSQWLCECGCDEHNKIITRGCRLKNGETTSCGCVKRKQTVEFNKNTKKKYNQYVLNLEDEHGVYGVGYCSNTNDEFYFDMDDYETIKDICWCKIQRGLFSSLVGRIPDAEHTTMHQLLGFSGCDHIDRNELNNRKYNFREASQQENVRNRSLASNNTSGVAGVCKTTNNKWCANIGYNGKRIYLGRFDNKEDAIKRRLLAEREYFKEFAPQKHLFEEYGITEENCNVV